MKLSTRARKYGRREHDYGQHSCDKLQVAHFDAQEVATVIGLGVIGGVGTLDPVYVDFAHSGTELGTAAQPFNSLVEGVAFVPGGGTLSLAAGSSTETFIDSLRLDKPVTLQATGGTVVIGAP